jgi:hypothetical protein
MARKYVGWLVLFVCLGAVAAVGAFSGSSAPATRPNYQPAAVPFNSGKVIFVSIESAKPGGYASVTVQASPGAECFIRYVTPHGTISRAKGLETQTADADGRANWTWKIGSKTEPGTGSVTVISNGSTATTSITIER